MNSNTIFGQSSSDQNGTVSFSELENAFKTPTQRQEYYERPDPETGSDMPIDLLNPEGEEYEEPVEEVSPEKSKRTGERIARLVDTGIDFALSNFVARNNETYRADEKDLEDIAECWGEISQERGWSMGPEMSLIILYVMVYGPLVKQAVADRRMAELEARQDDVEAKLDEILQRTNNQPEPTKSKPQEHGSTTNKPDSEPDKQPSPFKYQPREENKGSI